MFKALVVGVTEYAYAPPKAKPSFAQYLPSAARDVLEILQLGPLVVPSLGGQADIQVLPLVGKEETTAKNIRKGFEWLFSDSARDQQLLFYFSGHGALNQSNHYFVDEVLCPSDTQWDQFAPGFGIRDTDMMVSGGTDALYKRNARLEVILEMCTATGFDPAEKGVPRKRLRRFGCFFGDKGGDGGKFPAGRGAVWSASAAGECSFSGPVPNPCGKRGGPLQGLFTYFFRQQFPGKTREQLLMAIRKELSAYRSAFNECCCRPARLPTAGTARSDLTRTLVPGLTRVILPGDAREHCMDEQVPTLYASKGLEDRPPLSSFMNPVPGSTIDPNHVCPPPVGA